VFGSFHYVPILKAAKGEFQALRSLSPDLRSDITPLFDVINPPFDWKIERPKCSWEVHLERVVGGIRTAWPERGSLFIDFPEMELTDRTSNGCHPLICAFGFIREAALRVIPCMGLDRDTAFLKAVNQVTAKDKLGVCIRLKSDDLEDMGGIGARLARLQDSLHVNVTQTDLMIDFGYLPDSALNRSIALIFQLLEILREIVAYRTFTVTATGFPDSLSDIKVRSIGHLKRTEWILWKTITTSRVLGRLPTFGDYGICGPDFAHVDPRKIKSTANIRYTLSDEWLIVRGGAVRRAFGQFHDLASALIARPEFFGTSFSSADDWISRCARKLEKPGSLCTWRQIGTNHHMTVVVNQMREEAMAASREAMAVPTIQSELGG